MVQSCHSKKLTLVKILRIFPFIIIFSPIFHGKLIFSLKTKCANGRIKIADNVDHAMTTSVLRKPVFLFTKVSLRTSHTYFSTEIKFKVLSVWNSVSCRSAVSQLDS